jgi:hypothetical protein
MMCLAASVACGSVSYRSLMPNERRYSAKASVACGDTGMVLWAISGGQYQPSECPVCVSQSAGWGDPGGPVICGQSPNRVPLTGANCSG